MNLPRLAVLPVVVVAACGARDQTRPAVERPFELKCDSADTRESSSLFCVRIDTRDGDVRRVNLASIPVSNGPTRAAAEGPGGYQLVCKSTSTPATAEFRCVRLNRRTGELLLVNLPRAGVVPEDSAPRSSAPSAASPERAHGLRVVAPPPAPRPAPPSLPPAR